MDIVSFDGLIDQGKIVNIKDANLKEAYLIIGEYKQNVKEYRSTRFPVAAINVADLLATVEPPDTQSSLTYKALLNQTGTNAPVPTLIEPSTLEAQLGSPIVWSYIAVGQYRATLTNGFTIDKTLVLTGNGVTVLFGGAVGYCRYELVDPTTIDLFTYILSPGDLSTNTPYDDVLINFSIQIEVAPAAPAIP